MSEENALTQVKTSDSVFVRIGLFVVLGLLGGFGLWATFAPIDGASVAPGVVVVESSRKTIQHLEGGIVDEIHVREGEVVAPGQVLVSLDATQTEAQVALLKTQYVDLSARLARLKAIRLGLGEIDWESPQFELDAEERRIMGAARDDQMAIFERQRVELSSQLAVLDEQRAQLEQRLKGLKSSIPERQATVESYQEELATAQALVADGFATEQRVQELRRQLSNARATLSREDSELQSLQSQILELASRKVSLINGNGKQVDERLAEVRARHQDVVERLNAAIDRLERSVIRAPEAGVVLKLMLKTVGGVVSSGQPIMELVPTGDQLKVEARVPTQDIDRVSVGQAAEIMFPAFNTHTTPRLLGTVVRLSADRLVDQATGMPYFMAEIEVPETERARLGGQVLLPGMSAQILIKTGARSLFNYLAKPIADSMDRAFRED